MISSLTIIPVFASIVQNAYHAAPFINTLSDLYDIREDNGTSIVQHVHWKS